LPEVATGEVRGLAARAPVRGGTGELAGYAYAVRPVDDAFLARLAAAAGRPVASTELVGGAPPDAPAPAATPDPGGVGPALAATVIGSAILVSAGLAWWLAGIATRPLAVLVGAVDRAAAGDLASRARLGGRDETGRLGRGLDRILGDLQEAQRQSVTDALTGLGNLRHLRESMRRETERATRFGRTLGVLALDLDHFKAINDRYGHRVGDDVLVEFARRVVGVIREVDLAFRQGGEEFVILLPETDVAGSLTAARRIGEAVRERPFFARGTDVAMTVSIGVAVFARHASTATDVLAAADEALYRAKALGRDTYAIGRRAEDDEIGEPIDSPEAASGVAYAGGGFGGSTSARTWAGG
jgi:diguanylate cyclase (GGDEF)-like protein